MQSSSDPDGYQPRYPFDRELIAPFNSHARINQGILKGKKKKSSNRDFYNHKPDEIGGEHIWRCLRRRNEAVHWCKPGFKTMKRTNTRDGMTRQEKEFHRVEAELLAAEYMVNIVKLMEINDNQFAKIAIEALVAIGVNPAERGADRVKALQTVLMMTKAAPRAEIITTAQVTQIPVVRDVRALLEAKRAQLEGDSE